MSRLKLAILVFSGIMTLNAGQIQIGGGTNGANGLSTAFMSDPLKVSGTKVALPYSNTASGSLFQNAVGVATPGTTFNSLNGVLDGVSMIRDNVDSTACATGTLTTGPCDGWRLSSGLSTSGSTMTINVGIYGVAKVYTMLQDYWGASTLTNTVVSFNFGNSATNITSTETLDLVNGAQIRSAIDCTKGGTQVCAINVATTGSSTSIATTLAASSNLTSNLGHSINVKTKNLFQSTFTSADGGSGTGTGLNLWKNNTPNGGYVNLDEQSFDFTGFHDTDYLVSITIKSQLAAGQTFVSGSSGGNGISRTVLSALSVDTLTSVPEPSTLFLAFAGVGAVGYFRRRKA